MMPNQEITMDIKGMSCSRCEKSIKKSVGKLTGVQAVEVDLVSKKVSVDYESGKVTVQQIRHAIEEQGYEVINS